MSRIRTTIVGILMLATASTRASERCGVDVAVPAGWSATPSKPSDQPCWFSLKPKHLRSLISANDHIDMFTVDVSVERGTLAEVLPGYGFEKTDAGWIAQKGSGYTSARPLTVGVWEGVQATNSFRLHRESGEYVGMGMATVAFVSDGNVTLLVDGNLRSAGMITQVLIGAKYRRPPN